MHDIEKEYIIYGRVYYIWQVAPMTAQNIESYNIALQYR